MASLSGPSSNGTLYILPRYLQMHGHVTLHAAMHTQAPSLGRDDAHGLKRLVGFVTVYGAWNSARRPGFVGAEPGLRADSVSWCFCVPSEKPWSTSALRDGIEYSPNHWFRARTGMVKP